MDLARCGIVGVTRPNIIPARVEKIKFKDFETLKDQHERCDNDLSEVCLLTVVRVRCVLQRQVNTTLFDEAQHGRHVTTDVTVHVMSEVHEL